MKTHKIKSFICSVLVLFLMMPILLSAVVYAETAETVVHQIGISTVTEKSSGSSGATNYFIMTGSNYIKTNITVPEAGTYSFTLNHTSTGVGFGVSVSVGDVVQLNDVTLTKHDDNTGGSISSTYGIEQNLGNVLLQEGSNTITITTSARNGGSMIAVRTVTLEKQEIPFETIVQPINNTVSTIESNCTSSYITASYYMLLKNKYVTVPITVPEAGTYTFALKYVVPGTGMSVSVSVGDSVQINNASLTKHPDNTSASYSVSKYSIEETLGELTLEAGTNNITITTPESNGGSAVVLVQFTIDKPGTETAEPTEEATEEPTTEPTAEPTEAPTAEPTNVPVLSGNDATVIALNSTNENLVKSESGASVNTSYSQLGGGGSVSVPVMAESAGDYSITLRKLVAGANLRVSVAVDGTTQLSNVIIEHEGNTGYGSSYIKDQKLGNIALSEGLNIITVSAYTGNGGTPVMAYQITLQKPQEMEIIDFSLNNTSGGRMVYATREGFGTSAEVTLKKHGLVSPVYMVICAGYDKDGSLSSVNAVDIDCGVMQDGETKTFTAPITLDGNEKAVKAILMEKETYKPLAKAESVITLPLIEDELLTSNVSYQLATETLNNDGVYYSEYGLDTDDYKIDAIFYDGHNDTKVFAYIGYPKNASPSNKVPAMVLLHGGLGKAERYWVEKWNKLGFAAIAMDLYGRGPENDSTTSSGKKEHPYAGVSPYAVPGSFLSDVENAGMYQNIVAVINAHNILRDSGKVDTENVGITGISWGGVTTTTVIGIDNRFKFAAPVYGCGFLDQSKTYFSSAFSDSTATILWDPANFAAKADIPVLYVNGDTDANFSVNATSLTKGITKNSRMSIIHDFAHDQPHGDSVELVYDFAKNMVAGTDPYIAVMSEKAENGKFEASLDIPQGTEVKSAVMYYITTDELAFGGGNETIGWQSVSDYTLNGNTLEMTVPDEATQLYVSITDQNDYIISSRFIKAE